jgi:5-methylcytosine-specific restriction protein A
MPMRPCLVCGQPFEARPYGPSRCPEHEQERQRAKSRTKAEAKRRAEVVAAWREEHGDWCPGWGSQGPHPSRDLTADHVIPRSQGGEDGPLAVLCRRCNASRGHQEVRAEVVLDTPLAFPREKVAPRREGIPRTIASVKRWQAKRKVAGP